MNVTRGTRRGSRRTTGSTRIARCRGAAAAATLALAAGLVIGPQSTTAAQAAGATLTVDASAAYRPVTHVAAGGLYALKDNSTPPDSAILPLHLNSVTQPSPRVGQKPNGQPPGGDALITAPKADRTGAGVFIRMPDIYPDFPYRWVSWNDWNAKVDQQVADRLAATSTSNITGWELWNEPDWTWDTARAGSFNDGWARTFKRVRAKDNVTPIVGPSTAQYRSSAMRSFLTSAKASGTVPDIICWHELDNQNSIAAHIADYRAIERDLGISPRPISINEYGTPGEMNVPGVMAGYIGKLERGGVQSAHRAFWHEYGTVGGLLTPQGQPTGTWWLYKWYGDMAGNMVTTTPPAQTGIDGAAAHDETRHKLDVVFGGASGTNTVKLTGLGGFGKSVRVVLESAPATDRYTPVTAPTKISERSYTVTGGQVSVSVPDMTAAKGYHLTVTPTGSQPAYQHRYEAENASVYRALTRNSVTASNGSYVGNIDNAGDPRRDSYVDFVVNVPDARTYTMSIRYANGTGATSTQGLAYNGGPWSTVSYPPTSNWGYFDNTVTTEVSLKAGYNVIRLAKGAPHFAGGTGYAELDYIQLDEPDRGSAPVAPAGEGAVVDEGGPQGVSGGRQSEDREEHGVGSAR